MTPDRRRPASRYRPYRKPRGIIEDLGVLGAVLAAVAMVFLLAAASRL